MAKAALVKTDAARSSATVYVRHKLDSTERAMVELLQQDGRLTITQMARSLGVTEVTARRKLKRLLGDGIIRVVATVDPFDVGYETDGLT